MSTKMAEIADKLWLRENIEWPENDRPEQTRTARLFNLIYHRYFQDPKQFWELYFEKTALGLLLV